MANILSFNLRQWIWDDLLRVPPGFFNGTGEHPLKFGFWWRGPVIGTANAWENWVIGLIAIGLLALLLLWQRSAATYRALRVRIMAGGGHRRGRAAACCRLDLGCNGGRLLSRSS